MIKFRTLTFTCILSWPRHRFVHFIVQVTDGLVELKDVDRASVYEAGKDLADAAVKVLAQGFTLPYREVGATAFVVYSWAGVGAKSMPSPCVGYAMHRARKETPSRFLSCVPARFCEELALCFKKLG